MPDSYNNSANIFVINNTGGNAIITFSHEYSDDGVQTWQTGATTAPGAAAGPLVAGYNTGLFRSGNDFWFCKVQVLDGPNAGTYTTEGTLQQPSKQCTLEADDNKANLYFTVSTSSFYMFQQSGSCTTGMSAAKS
jgi:Up-Regulated in long-lived daf-2